MHRLLPDSQIQGEVLVMGQDSKVKAYAALDQDDSDRSDPGNEDLISGVLSHTGDG